MIPRQIWISSDIYLWFNVVKGKESKGTAKGNPGNQSDSGYDISNQAPSADEEISSLMDEAKTMWKVGSYHENIVNLQGISVNVEEGSIRRVSNL